MRRILIFLAALVLLSPSAKAANSTVAAMTAASALGGTELTYIVQGGADRKGTPAQFATYIYGLASGDCTISGVGAIVCTKTNGSAFTALATTAPGTGVATALGVNVGSAGAFVTFNGALGTPSSGTATNLTGTAASLTAGTATNAVNSGITNDTTTNATMFPAWVTANTGNLPLKTTSTKLTFNPSTGVLSSTSFTGAGTGLTGTAASLTAGNVTTIPNLTGDVTSVGNATTLTNAPVIAKVLTGFTSGAGTVTAADSILSAIQKVYGNDALKAPLASPALTGTPTAPTATVGTNTTQLATTAFVIANAGSGTGANPTATASDTAVNGVATTFMRSDAAPPVQKGTSTQFGVVKCDGTTITCGSSIFTAVPGVASRTVTGATDTILSTDRGNIVYYNSASSIAVTQPAPSGSFAAGFFTTVCQINNGIPTVTPGSGTIGGAGTLALPAGGTAANPICTSYQSDGTNFNLIPSWMVNASLLTAGTIPSARLGFGTNVFAAAANTLSSAGGLTSTIASGTAVLGTAAIGSNACATVVTVSATNVATTDVVSFGYNGDPTAIAGYGASGTGAILSVYPYPTANNVNVKVCNWTSASITPGALTLNWRVWR